MKISILLLVVCASVFMPISGMSNPPYAIKQPLIKPTLFAEGTVSLPSDEFGGTFTPDGTSFYFVKRTPTTTSKPFSVICVTHFRQGKWSTPEVASFSGKYSDSGPVISPDGSKFFFTSFRPVAGRAGGNSDLWMMTKTATGWSEPINLGEPVNTDGPEQSASVTRDGTLYFSAARNDTKGSLDIYRSQWKDGHYMQPENVGANINTEFAELHPFISADERFLFFVTIGREDIKLTGGSPYARSDLYVSSNSGNGWSGATNMGEKINSLANEYYPMISPDGKYFFFSSDRGFTNIPMKNKLTYKEFEANLHGVLGGSQNIYQVDWSELKIR